MPKGLFPILLRVLHAYFMTTDSVDLKDWILPSEPIDPACTIDPIFRPFQEKIDKEFMGSVPTPRSYFQNQPDFLLNSRSFRSFTIERNDQNLVFTSTSLMIAGIIAPQVDPKEQRYLEARTVLRNIAAALEKNGAQFLDEIDLDTFRKLRGALRDLCKEHHENLMPCLPDIFYLMELVHDTEVYDYVEEFAMLLTTIGQRILELGFEEDELPEDFLDRLKVFQRLRTDSNIFLELQLAWLFHADGDDDGFDDYDHEDSLPDLMNKFKQKREAEKMDYDAEMERLGFPNREKDIGKKDMFKENSMLIYNWPLVIRNLRNSCLDHVFDFYLKLMNLSKELAHEKKDQRRPVFLKCLNELNAELTNPDNPWLHVPGRILTETSTGLGSERLWRILSIKPEECRMLPSRERCPFFVLCETMQTCLPAHSPLAFVQHNAVGYGVVDVLEGRVIPSGFRQEIEDFHDSFHHPDLLGYGLPPGLNRPPVEENLQELYEGRIQVPQTAQLNISTVGNMTIGQENSTISANVSSSGYMSRKSVIRHIFGEFHEEKERRFRAQSPYGHLHGWRLTSFIAKAGDDMRVEALAMKIIRTIQKIFKVEKVDIWMKPYAIVVCGDEGGLIETLKNVVSIDHIKKKRAPFKELKGYFESMYGSAGSYMYGMAAINFAASLAGYSLLTYILQAKDRHNANIMLDKDGHIVHIDFGFVLGMSPGTVSPFELDDDGEVKIRDEVVNDKLVPEDLEQHNLDPQLLAKVTKIDESGQRDIELENAPFKITKDYVDVLGGTTSLEWQFFEELFIGGYFAIQRHLKEIYDIILFASWTNAQIEPDEVIDEIKSRMSRKTINEVRELIATSLTTPSTQLYDIYQKKTNNIEF